MPAAGLDTLVGGHGLGPGGHDGAGGRSDSERHQWGRRHIQGFESFVTGAGNDLIYGQTGDAEYLTNGGNDIVKLSGSGAKTVVTGAGNDLIEVYGGTSFALDMGATPTA